MHGGIGGNCLLTPKVLEAALAKNPDGSYVGLNSIGAVRLAQAYEGRQVLTELLRGDMPDGSKVPVVGYDALVNDGKPVEGVRPWAVVRTLDLAMRTKGDVPYDDQQLSNLADLDEKGNIVRATDSQVIAHSGGVTEATAVLQRATTNHFTGFSVTYKVTNPFNHSKFNPKEDQASIVLLVNASCYQGNARVNTNSNFVAVDLSDAVFSKN